MEEIVSLKETLALLVSQTIEFMHNSNEIRVSNALLTISIVLKALFSKQLEKQGFSLMEYLFGFEPESAVKRLLSCLQHLLGFQRAELLRGLALATLSVIATGTEIISQNGFMEYGCPPPFTTLHCSCFPPCLPDLLPPIWDCAWPPS